MTGTLTSSLTVSMPHIRHIRPETLETVVIRLEHWSQSPVITNHSLLRPDTIDQSQLWPRLWSHQLPTTMGGVGGGGGGGGAWEDTDQYSAAVSHSHQPPSCNHL